MQKEWRKTTKIRIGALIESYRERKSWKTFEKVSLNTWRTVLKKFFTWFLIDRKTDSIDRKCFDWFNTNRAPIETDRESQTFLIAILIGRKTISTSWNSGKISFFWKTKQNNAETPQSIEFYESHAWVWDEMLFKNTCFEPNFPKIKIFNPFS